MDPIAGIAIYFVLWWVVLFAVLPWGVRSQHETGEAIPGSEAGAPVRPALWKKALATTLIAAVAWVFVAWIYIYQPISFDDVPFMPDLSNEY
ncbi:MAG: hypothetical protein AMXMBFR74_30900 [Parvibaculum sp.]|jgi:predicted secreted protein|uniref:DUF1467 family protein n=1 Tax=Parvibaculum sp. TaxID=2024848 RepID=UPI0035BB9ACC